MMFCMPLSESFGEPTLLLFKYEIGDSNGSYTQGRKQIVQPLKNLTLPANSTGTELLIEGVSAGSVTIDVDSPSQELIGSV